MPPVSGKNVNADLVHGIAVRRGSRKSDERFSVVCADRQHIPFPAFFAQSVAPLRQIESGKVLRRKQFYAAGAGKFPQTGQVRQKVFTHEAELLPVGSQNVVENVQIRRFKAVLGRIAAQKRKYLIQERLACLGDNVVSVGDEAASDRERQINARPLVRL